MKPLFKNLFAGTAIFLSLGAPRSGFAATANVSVNNLPTGFVPPTSNINVGDSVVWNWPSGSFFHDVTSTSPTPQWTASPTQNGVAFFTNTFNTSGTFPYKCSIHMFTGQINVAASTQPPNVSITNPLSGSLFASPANVTIQATASDPNSGGFIINVSFLVGASIVTNQFASPFFAVTNNVGSGTYLLKAIATDNFGLKATNSINIVVDAPPTLIITNPVSGAVLAAPANVLIQASATDTDGTVTNVQFRVGTNILSNQISPPFSAVTNNLGSGTYTLTAIAADNQGLKATNSTSIVVDVPPTVTITNPAAGTVLAEPANVMVQASASDTDGTVTNVQLLVGSVVLTNATVAPYSAATNSQTAGSYTLSAVATDNFGLTATNSVILSIVTPAAVVLDGSAQSSSNSFQFNYSANAGLSYVIQQSTDLASGNWTSIFTNTATNSPVTFIDTNAIANPAFYRVILLPNP